MRWGLLCRVGSLVLGPGLAAVVAVAGVAEQAALAADLLAGARLLLALGLLALLQGLCSFFWLMVGHLLSKDFKPNMPILLTKNPVHAIIIPI